MTRLARLLAQQIAATGPISLADFMTDCLLHPQHGYYTTRDPMGPGGDFTTAPEISQMFGELIGLALAQAWVDQDRPDRIVLAELGPGRGTLMADALRAANAVPGFADAAAVHFVEASPNLRAEQAARVPDATWHAAVEDLPAAPLYLVANEFLDALPIRQFRRDADGWREVMVGLDGDAALTFGVSQPAPIAALDSRLGDTSPGDVVEICPALPAIVGTVGCRIAEHRGAAVFVDYGHWRSLGDTFQALRGHAAEDPLACPGEADLTAHVDFEALARAAAPARASAMTAQGVFLERLGITARAQSLARGLAGADLEAVVAAHRRLTHPTQMGDLFKVMGLTPKGAPPLPGLDP